MINDDLQQLDTLIQKRLEANNKQLRFEIREDTKAEIKAEVEPLHERLDAQREQITTVEKNLSNQISREANDIADVIRDVVIPKLEQHDTDIAELQEEAGLKPRRY